MVQWSTEYYTTIGRKNEYLRLCGNVEYELSSKWKLNELQAIRKTKNYIINYYSSITSILYNEHYRLWPSPHVLYCYSVVLCES